jgi:hypothetical protein
MPADLINSMNISNRRGDLPNLTKKQFAELVLSNMPHVENMVHDAEWVSELPDGRILVFHHIIFPACHGDPELREWCAELYTLDQRTPRCLRRWKIRKAWVYYAPYDERRGTYKTDPSGRWSYRVFE